MTRSVKQTLKRSMPCADLNAMTATTASASATDAASLLAKKDGILLGGPNDSSAETGFDDGRIRSPLLLMDAKAVSSSLLEQAALDMLLFGMSDLPQLQLLSGAGSGSEHSSNKKQRRCCDAEPYRIGGASFSFSSSSSASCGYSSDDSFDSIFSETNAAPATAALERAIIDATADESSCLFWLSDENQHEPSQPLSETTIMGFPSKFHVAEVTYGLSRLTTTA